MIILLHILLAALLFYLVNWIGEYSSTFGYSQVNLVLVPEEAPAFNFLLRSLSPGVLVILFGVSAYTLHLDGLIAGLWKVAVYYYALRLLVIAVLNQMSMVNWPKFGLQAAFGIAAAHFAYWYLVIPRRPLFPDLSSIGNQLWIGIALFLYATFNNIRPSSSSALRRKNRYLARRLHALRRDYSSQIEGQFPERYMELVVYAIMIYEDFNRPPLIRQIERMVYPRWSRTLGVMQVRTDKRISDVESVQIGVAQLRRNFQQTRDELDLGEKKPVRGRIVNRTIAKYNRDERYVSAVMALVDTLWAQIATEYRPDFERMWSDS